MQGHKTALLLAASIVLSTGICQAASPRLHRILPGGIERGAVGQLVFHGERLEGAEEILFYDAGFEVLRLEGSDESVTATIRVADDCRLGEHVAHLRTRNGVSEFRPFYVEPLPQLMELEPNNSLGTAQPVALNTTLAGQLTKGDADVFVIEAQAGDHLKAEVLAMRLGNVMLDTYVAILDSTGRRLASSSGHPFSLQDGIVSVPVPKDGKYLVKIREVDHGGGKQCNYRLHVGSFPRPVAIFPPGGKMGEKHTVRFLGDPAGSYEQTLTLPATFDRNYGLSGLRDGKAAPTPIPFRLSAHRNALEVEPNNKLAQATPVQLPDAFCGIIENRGDQDCFRFAAQAGEHFDIECYARRVRSPLDSVMELYDAAGDRIYENDDGAKVTENDDAEPRAPDSHFRVKIPADGLYTLRVRDRLGRGGPSYVYRVEFNPVQPWMLVRLPRVEDPNGLYGQYRQQIFVARGNYFAALVRARFKDFQGRLVLEMPDLPEGVTMETMTIPAGTNAFPVVFHAHEDAKISGKLVAMRGRHADREKNITGGFYSFADLMHGKPEQARLKTKIVERVPVVVTERVPFRLRLQAPEVPLVRDGKMELRVEVERDPGFEEEIFLKMPFLPPGVATSSGERVAAGQKEAVFTLTAHPKITPRDWMIYVLGSAGKENNLFWASTPLVPLRVDKQFVLADLQQARGRQGAKVSLPCRLSPVTPFQGVARARLKGLPSGVTAEDVSFRAADKQVVFELALGPQSPVGKHATLECEVEVPGETESIVARAGRGELRIAAANLEVADPGTDGAKEQASAAVVPANSRLEQLRAEAESRRAAASLASPSGGDAK